MVHEGWHAADAVIFFECVLLLVVLRIEISQLDVDVDRVRIELGDFPVNRQRVPRIAMLEVVVGEDLVLALGLHRQALFAVEIGQLGVDVELGGIELVDLFVDGDGFEEEAVARIVIGDPAENLDRFIVAVDADPEVADAIQSVDIAGVVIEEAFVFFDRRLDLSLRNQLLGAGEGLSRSVDGVVS